MAERRLIDDCFLTDGERLRHDEALGILRERVGPVVGVESVPLHEALNRILAETVTSPRNVPSSDNAAVDGYAYAHADYAGAGGFFPVAARIAAGHPSPLPLPTGSAARIFTGATMPAGADTVAMQEDCETHRQDGRDFVAIPPGLKHGANRRKAGEDLAEGATIAEPGTRLRPQEIAAIASTGRSGISVYCRLRVAIVSTGDEIVRPGAPLQAGRSLRFEPLPARRAAEDRRLRNDGCRRAAGRRGRGAPRARRACRRPRRGAHDRRRVARRGGSSGHQPRRTRQAPSVATGGEARTADELRADRGLPGRRPSRQSGGGFRLLPPLCPSHAGADGRRRLAGAAALRGRGGFLHREAQDRAAGVSARPPLRGREWEALGPKIPARRIRADHVAAGSGRADRDCGRRAGRE